MIGRSFFAVVGTFFSITPRSCTSWRAGSRRPRQRDRRRHDRRVHDAAIEAVLPDGLDAAGVDRGPEPFALFDRIFEYLDLRHDIEDAPAHGRSMSEVAGTVEPATSASATRSARIRRPRSRRPISRTRTRHARSGPSTGSRCASRADSSRRSSAEAGKTTITYLVPRLYDVQHGSVTIDGHTTCGASRPNWGDVIGVVTQETYLFHTTIRWRTCCMWPPRGLAGRARGRRAGRVHPRPHRRAARRLRHGGGGSGYKPSGGEKQRLAIAV